MVILTVSNACILNATVPSIAAVHSIGPCFGCQSVIYRRIVWLYVGMERVLEYAVVDLVTVP